MAFGIESVQQTVDEIQTSLAAVSQAVHSGFDRVVIAIGETRHDMNVVLDAVQADIRSLDATSHSSTDGQAAAVHQPPVGPLHDPARRPPRHARPYRPVA